MYERKNKMAPPLFEGFYIAAETSNITSIKGIDIFIVLGMRKTTPHDIQLFQ